MSFSVKQGEVLGFLGPNGAGKTTTIRQLMGFIKPDSGSLSILGRDCFREAGRIQESLGYLPGEIHRFHERHGIYPFCGKYEENRRIWDVQKS